MKKILLAVLLAALLVTGAVADEVAITEPKEKLTTAENDSLISSMIKDSLDDSQKSASTSDSVTVADDGTITVVTPEGISMTVTPPFGTIAFGQDLLAQLELFFSFEDPTAIIDAMIADNTHIVVMDLAFGTYITFDTSVDTISNLLGDIDDSSEAILLSVVSALQVSDAPYYVSTKTLGDNTFLVFDYRKTGDECMIYTSVKNSTNIDVYLLPGGETITDSEIQLLEDMLSESTITAA